MTKAQFEDLKGTLERQHREQMRLLAILGLTQSQYTADVHVRQSVKAVQCADQILDIVKEN